jgi:hypothetical protein
MGELSGTIIKRDTMKTAVSLSKGLVCGACCATLLCIILFSGCSSPVQSIRNNDSNDSTVIYSNKDWYKAEKTEELTWAGVIRAVPPSNISTTLMREYYYILEREPSNYSIYAEKGDLDGFVDKMVIVYGKLVNQELEGMKITELWPGTIVLDDKDY